MKKKEALEVTVEDRQLQPAFSLMHWNQLQDRQFSSVVNSFASVRIDVWQASVAFVLCTDRRKVGTPLLYCIEQQAETLT